MESYCLSKLTLWINFRLKLCWKQFFHHVILVLLHILAAIVQKYLIFFLLYIIVYFLQGILFFYVLSGSRFLIHNRILMIKLLLFSFYLIYIYLPFTLCLSFYKISFVFCFFSFFVYLIVPWEYFIRTIYKVLRIDIHLSSLQN